jgi:hypothetical protein
MKPKPVTKMTLKMEEKETLLNWVKRKLGIIKNPNKKIEVRKVSEEEFLGNYPE